MPRMKERTPLEMDIHVGKQLLTFARLIARQPEHKDDDTFEKLAAQIEHERKK